ncbi:hypothetical protein ANO11243_021570 [Dothideomycetidae sp. 11243]|nr:hypothetical protein ANO11243_021570 [fungal sp. No.11243]
MRRFVLLSPRRLATPSALRVRFASSDYGSPSSKADPASDPQNAGPNPSADKEHPGPAPPKEGQGTGAGPTKAHKDGHNSTTKQGDVMPTQGNKHTQKRGFHTSASRWAEKKGEQSKETKKAQPKILSAKPPSPEEESEDVKAHNKAFENRAEKAHQKVKPTKTEFGDKGGAENTTRRDGEENRGKTGQ